MKNNRYVLSRHALHRQINKTFHLIHSWPWLHKDFLQHKNHNPPVLSQKAFSPAQKKKWDKNHLGNRDTVPVRNETVEIAVQVNGKVKARLQVATDIEAADAIALAKTDEKVASAIEGKTVVKELYVKGRLVNIVVKM